MAENFFLKDLGYYTGLKKVFNNVYNREWKSISYPEYVGYCTKKFEGYRNLCNDDLSKMSRQGFCDYYLGDEYFNLEYFWKLAEFYKAKCDARRQFEVSTLRFMRDSYNGMKRKTVEDYAEVTLEQCFDDIINHVIIETYAGHIYEMKMRDICWNNGCTVEEVDNEEIDIKYGVDLICKRGAGVVAYIQVKPVTTFLGNRNESLKEDRKAFFVKEEKKKEWCEKVGYKYSETKFVLYNDEKDDFIRDDENKISFFKLEELSDGEGNALMKF